MEWCSALLCLAALRAVRYCTVLCCAAKSCEVWQCQVMQGSLFFIRLRQSRVVRSTVWSCYVPPRAALKGKDFYLFLLF